MDTPFWIDIELETVDTKIRLTARGSRGESTAPRILPIDLDRLDTFARKVGRAVANSRPLEETTLDEAHAIHATLFDGQFRDLAVRLTEAAKGTPVLQRLVLRDRGLQAIPWEALCEPTGTGGFWGASPSIRLARGVPSLQPWEPRDVAGAVRLLVIAPTFEQVGVQRLHATISGSIANRELEWLEPIVGHKASKKYLFDTLRKGKQPHIVHYLGHGSLDNAGNPILRLNDDEDGEEDWIRVASFADELAANFHNELRLVVLEACEGGRPGQLGSAAELLVNRAGIDAVMAHLWPVRADVASACSRGFYQSLITHGKVASSLGDVRRWLLLHGAQAFSPVLYLRSTSETLFHFDKRADIREPTGTTIRNTISTGAGTMPWLTEPLVCIWKGSKTAPSRLQFDLRAKDGSVQSIEKELAELRTHYVGRDNRRKDNKTLNDLVLPSRRVSQDAAAVDLMNGRWIIRNTSDKPRLLVNMIPLQPGESSTLSHGTSIMVGDVGGQFLDGRFFPIAPMTAADPLTGLLSREGLACEAALILAARKSKALLMLHFAPHDEQSAGIAARVLHETEPALPIGRIGATVGMLVDNDNRMELRLDTLKRAGLMPHASGYSVLRGPSGEAGARVDAALSALTRLAVAGNRNELVDLNRYTLPLLSPNDLAQAAREARSSGGGLGLILLDEIERYGALEEAARAAIELELREQLGAMLQEGDRVAAVGPGAMIVVTQRSVDELLRAVVTAWRARGVIALGALELDRSLRVCVLNDLATEQLVARPESFLRELGTGTNAHGLPMPIAYWLETAHQSASPREKAQALVRTIEMTWRLLGCVLVAAFWTLRKKETLNPGAVGDQWPPWRGATTAAAEALRASEGRVGELADAVCQVSAPGTGTLAIASECAMSLSLMLAASSCDEQALEKAANALDLLIYEVFVALRCLRGWSLVAVRKAEQLDVMGMSSHVDYVDFTGPYALGLRRRHAVAGIRIFEFVYFARWTEGIAIPLEPLVRRVATGTNEDGLALVEEIPKGSGLHGYIPASANGRLELRVTDKHFLR